MRFTTAQSLTPPAGHWPRSDSEKSPVRLVRQSHSGCRRLGQQLAWVKRGEVGGVGGQVQAEGVVRRGCRGRRENGAWAVGSCWGRRAGWGWPSGAVVAPVGQVDGLIVAEGSGFAKPRWRRGRGAGCKVQAVRSGGAALVEQGGAHAGGSQPGQRVKAPRQSGRRTGQIAR